MLPTRSWRSLLKHANGKHRRGASSSRSVTRVPRPRRFSTTPQRTALKQKRSARETCEGGDNAGGVLGDHRDRLFQYASRPPGRSTEALERAFSAAKPATHRHPLPTVKSRSAEKDKEDVTSTLAISSTHEARGFFRPACQVNPSLESGGSMSARRAAPPMQRRPDGAKHSRHV